VDVEGRKRSKKSLCQANEVKEKTMSVLKPSKKYCSELHNSSHVRYHIVTYQGYRAILSANAFFHGVKKHKRDTKRGIIWASHYEDEHYMYTRLDWTHLDLVIGNPSYRSLSMPVFGISTSTSDMITRRNDGTRNIILQFSCQLFSVWVASGFLCACSRQKNSRKVGTY